MNKIYLMFSVVLLVTVTTFAQKKGVNFIKNDWSAILADAKAQDKLVFLDAYTTWCGPCKKMDRDVYPQSSVADYYNEMFINVKMDMEKGLGIELARDYNIKAYPSFLFINGDGKVMHRSAGYHTPEQFVSLGSEAIDPSRQVASMEKRYTDGDRSPRFLIDYTNVRYDIADGSHGDIAQEYLNTQEDWGTEDNRKFLFAFANDTESKMFNYLLDNQPAFAEMYGQPAVTAKVQQLIYGSIQDSKSESSLEQVERLFNRAYPDNAEELLSRFKLSFYRQAGDREKYMDAAIAHYKKYPSDDQAELNETAWTFFRITKDKKRIKQAIKYAKKSIKLDSNYYNNDTLASLYYRLGKKKKAIKAANKAIETAKRDEIDFGPTTEFLQKIADGSMDKE